MKITLSEIYKAMIEQELPINFNNTINSLKCCKTEIEFKDNDYMKTSEFKAELEKLGYTFEMSNGYCYTSEMFDQNWKEDKFMKTSEFKAELRKLGYVFEDDYVKNEQDLTSAWISPVHVNAIITGFGPEVSPKLFNLITKYAATPIVEREDEKLFNVQIIKGKWGLGSWLYRDCDDEVSTSFAADNNESNQRWTIEQIKEYGIDDEEVYERVPVED